MIDIAPDSPPRIFFGVGNEGVKVYSWATNDAILVKSTGGYNNDGVTYDSLAHKLYWSSNDTIYRGDPDDAETEIVFNSFRHGINRSLAHDWITGNLYGVSSTGIVCVCSTILVEQLECEVLLSGRGDLITITFNPVAGLMYWTDYVGNTIQRAEMDGTEPTILVSRLVSLQGITIGIDSSRLYWIEQESSKIQCSDLQGKDIHTVVTLSGGTLPKGIATLSDRVYWGNFGPQTLQSITKAGENVRNLYDGKNNVHQLAVATSRLPL